MNPLHKWLAWYSPLLAGRFDFFLHADAPRFDALARGLLLTRGRFWTRIAGGGDLRRAVGRSPTRADPIVGRCDGRATVIATFPWVGHAASAAYWYALHVVGAGGVTDDRHAPHARAVFDAAGELLGPMPNPALHLRAAALSGGRTRLTWQYDETMQETPPQDFVVYNDAATPGTIDYGTIVATVAYRRRAGGFEFVNAPLPHGTRRSWAVRARSTAGVVEPNAATAWADADAQPPADAAAPPFFFPPFRREGQGELM